MIMITVRVSMRCIITTQDTNYTNLSSAEDPGSFMPDPGSRILIFPSRIQGQKDSDLKIPPDPIKEFKCFFTLKTVSKLWEKLSRMFVHTGSRMRIFPIPNPDPGSWGQKGTIPVPDPQHCYIACYFLPYVATVHNRIASPLLLSAW
jgi:hypothetical protein